MDFIQCLFSSLGITIHANIVSMYMLKQFILFMDKVRKKIDEYVHGWLGEEIVSVIMMSNWL